MAEVGCGRLLASWTSSKLTSPPPKQEHGLLALYQIQKCFFCCYRIHRDPTHDSQWNSRKNYQKRRTRGTSSPNVLFKSLFLHQTRSTRTSYTAYIVVLNTVFLSYPQRSVRPNEGFLSSVPTLASAQGSLDDETFWRSGLQKRSRCGRVFRDMSMCTLKKERGGMQVLSFTDESRKRIRANCRRHSGPPVIHANVIFPTCIWESAINVSFGTAYCIWLFGSVLEYTFFLRTLSPISTFQNFISHFFFLSALFRKGLLIRYFCHGGDFDHAQRQCHCQKWEGSFCSYD